MRCVGRTLPRLSSSYTSTRSASNVPSEDPAKKARSILDSLPGNSILSKTAILSSGAGLSIFAISNELYVFNDESIVAIAGFSVLWGLFKYGAPVYNEWARATQAKISGILNASREDHRAAVKSRIENVKQLGGVIDVTKQLFEVSKVEYKLDDACSTNPSLIWFKETARLEAEAFELEQRTALALEAKQVLDSWVRYEGQVKQRQQKELAESIIGKVMKELENPKTLQQILQQSVSEVES